MKKCPDRGKPFLSKTSEEVHTSQFRAIREGFQAEVALRLTFGSKKDLARAWEKKEHSVRWGQGANVEAGMLTKRRN